jgi:DNA polymerase-3 subunit delta
MIHLYYGEDDLGLRRQLDAVAAAFARKYGAENVVRVDAGQANAESILSELVNVGLFSAQRLVVMRGVFANRFLSEKLIEILPRVPSETEVIIVEPAPDKRVKLYKTLVKSYQAKEFVANKNLSGFVMDEANDKRVEINRAGIDELINYTGGDRWRIVSELEKFANLGKLVTPELVRQQVEPELQASAFNLLDNLLAGRRDKVLEELTKLRAQEDPNKFFGLLSSQIFALAVAVNAGDKSSGEIAKETGVHPYVISKMLDSSRRISKADARRYARIISKTDEQLKSSKTEAWTLIELAISKF